MRKVSHQGLSLSAGQRHRLQIERSMVANHYAPVDWDGLRNDLNSRVFVGPPTPMHLRIETAPDREAERFWRMADNFRRYGYCEFEESSPPFVGEAFGYGQSTEVYL